MKKPYNLGKEEYIKVNIEYKNLDKVNCPNHCLLVKAWQFLSNRNYNKYFLVAILKLTSIWAWNRQWMSLISKGYLLMIWNKKLNNIAINALNVKELVILPILLIKKSKWYKQVIHFK